MAELGLSTMERLMKKAGAKRVSKDAALELGLLLENISAIISNDAAEFAVHAGRKTVFAEDIKLAAKKKGF